MSEQKLKIVFAPGCFDDFDGSQEELNELLAEINRMVDTGEILENARPLDELDLEDLPDDVAEWLAEDFSPDEGDSPKNTRH
jgi:hypothetical protein